MKATWRANLYLAVVLAAALPVAPLAADNSSPKAQTSAPEQPEFTRTKVTQILRNARKIVTPNGVEELMEVQIGSTKQWISVRGRDRRNPVLLMIHGGPASPEMPTSWFFQNGWEDFFTVVQWDQRGSGKSYASNDPAMIRPTLTLDRMVEDAREVAQFLSSRFNKQKVFVLGHSWGSIVGVSLAQRHPELLHAYIGMGQVIDGHENERVNYQHTLRAAEAAGNQAAIADLRAIVPYPREDGSVSLEQIDKERRWSVHFGGLSYKRDSIDYYLDLAKLSPEYSEQDVAAIDKGSQLSLVPILPILTGFDFSGTTRFRCPILLFEGRYDFTTPSEVVAEWYGRVRAPSKKLVWFERSAHMMMVEEPGRFLLHLVQDALPYAQKAGDVPEYRQAREQ